MRLPRHPRVWLAGLLAWLGLLWWLSSRQGLPGPDLIPHFDKVAHFTYFAGGAFLFGGWQVRKPGFSRISGRLMLLTIVFISVVGIIDESDVLLHVAIAADRVAGSGVLASGSFSPCKINKVSPAR